MPVFVWFAAGLLVVAALVVLVIAPRVTPQRLWWGGLLALLTATALVLAAAPLQGRETVWHWQMPGALALQWRLDARTWPWAVTALVMALVISLTDAIRAERGPAEGSGWAGVLLAGALAVPAVLAASPWAFGMFWALFDGAALVADLGRLSRARHRNTAIWVAFARALTWLAAGVTAVLWPDRLHEAMLLWFGVLAVRLWVATLEPGVMAADVPPWRLTWAALHLWGVLAAAVWASTQVWTPPRALFGALGGLALWGVWRWQRTRVPLRQITASGLALGSLALLTAARGLPAAAWAWSLLAVFPALGMALMPYRAREVWVFAGLLVAGLTLWPLTPGSAAAALWRSPWHTWMLGPWLVLAGSLVALARQGAALQRPEEPLTREKRAFHVLGMTLWIATFWGWQFWPFAESVEVAPWVQWGAGGAALLVAAGMVWAARREYAGLERVGRAEAWLSKRMAQWTGFVFWKVYRSIGRFLRFLSLLLEGDGGVLWAWVLLAMLAVLLQR